MTLREFAINHSGRVLNVFNTLGDCLVEKIEGIDLLIVHDWCSEMNYDVLTSENTDSGMNVTIEYKEIHY